jgi:hypothetical protein
MMSVQKDVEISMELEAKWPVTRSLTCQEISATSFAGGIPRDDVLSGLEVKGWQL